MTSQIRSMPIVRIICSALLMGLVSIEDRPAYAGRNANQVQKINLHADLSLGEEDGDGIVFGRVMGVASRSDGGFVILDNGFLRVLQFSENGQLIQTFGSRGQGPGEFSFPTAIATDSENRTYVGDTSRVVIFDSQGIHIDGFNHGISGADLRSLAVDSSGNVYVSCFDLFGQEVIHKYSSKHELVGSFCDSYAVNKGLDVRAEQAFAGGHIVSESDRIYFSQRYPYEIRRFTLDGSLEAVFHRKNNFMSEPIFKRSESGIEIGLPAASSGLAVLRGGRVLNSVVCVVDYETGIKESILDLFDIDGELLASSRLDGAWVVEAVDDSGRVFVAVTKHCPRVARYSVEVVPEN